MPMVIRKLGKAIGSAALLNIVAYIVFGILTGIINEKAKIDELGEITFIISFLLTLYFPVLIVLYWIIFMASPANRWIENHSRGFQLSLVVAGFGMGLSLSLEALSVQRKGSFPWSIIGIILSLSPFPTWMFLSKREESKGRPSGRPN